jgi:hypothetical protein
VTEKNQRLDAELRSFARLWKGGFIAGDPLTPVGWSVLGPLGFLSVHHAIYLMCIKPYVNDATVALEIGPGRGAWTRALLPAKEVWCLDALSAEHNAFWKYVGEAPHVNYFQVEDFSCSMLPDASFDFFFSYDVFCHISFDGISEYMRNIYPKLKPGAQGFLMVADYEKYNRAIEAFDDLSIYKATYPKHPLLRWTRRLVQRRVRKRMAWPPCDLNEDSEPRPGRWYHAGVDRTCAMMRDVGYEIVDPDIGVSHRDPIIHFRR